MKLDTEQMRILAKRLTAVEQVIAAGDKPDEDDLQALRAAVAELNRLAEGFEDIQRQRAEQAKLQAAFVGALVQVFGAADEECGCPACVERRQRSASDGEIHNTH